MNQPPRPQRRTLITNVVRRHPSVPRAHTAAQPERVIPPPPIAIRYAEIPAVEIFGMVGRCGGGYNTVWEDWSPEGRLAREQIMEEFERELDKKCGHYKKLEESMLAEGMRNPLIITCGMPLVRKVQHLPPEMRTWPLCSLLLLEGTTGGSRLWIAQKHNLTVQCLINDRVQAFEHCPLITTADEAKTYFKDKISLKITPQRGLHELHDQFKPVYHLEEEWHNTSTMDMIRAPIWYNAMRRYGYNIPMTPQFKQLLGVQR